MRVARGSGAESYSETTRFSNILWSHGTGSLFLTRDSSVLFRRSESIETGIVNGERTVNRFSIDSRPVNRCIFDEARRINGET